MSVLSRPVLVLNKNWQAVNVEPLQKVLGMLFKYEDSGMPKARIIDPSEQFALYDWSDWSRLKPREGEPFVRGIDTIFRVPEVVQVSEYNKTPAYRVTFSRKQLYKRDNYRCQYCGVRSEELNIDHILPRAQGGQTTWENCVVACITCNSRKADRTPEQAGMVIQGWIKNPEKRRMPFKPKFNLFKGDIRIRSWESFLGAAYWNTELENDNK